MELRLLVSEAERAAFEHGLTQARMKNGAGFVEKQRSRLGRVHMAFADLYGLFDETSTNPERMLAGFAIHSLDLFSQSYPKPDLTHLPPETVFEVGELWARTLGAGAACRWGCTLLAGLNKARAVLIYPIVKPWDWTTAYPDFKRIDAPIEWPFVETLDRRKVYVQAMMIEGMAMQWSIAKAAQVGFESCDGNQRIRFDNPLARVLSERRTVRMQAALHRPSGIDPLAVDPSVQAA